MFKKTLTIIVFIYFFIRIPFDILSFFKLDNTNGEHFATNKAINGFYNLTGWTNEFENKYVKIKMPFFDWTRPKDGYVREGEVSTSLKFFGGIAYNLSLYGHEEKILSKSKVKK